MPTRASYNFSRPRHWQTERQTEGPDPARPPDSRLHASTPSWRQPRPASVVAPASLRAGFGALGPADGAGRPGGRAGPGLGNAGHSAKIGAVSAGRALVADQPGTKAPLADAGGQLPAFVAGG